MVKLINDSVIDTAKVLADRIQISINASKLNRGATPYLDEIKFHLDNKRPNGAYTKYSISKLRFLIGFLGPKYLLE